MFRTIVRWTVRLGVLMAVADLVKRIVGRRHADRGQAVLAHSDTWPPVPRASDQDR